MGVVNKARDTRLDRIVAIKVSKDEFSERFEREARAVASLNHPHICQLYDVGPNYLVMEYIEGEPLKGPLPLDKAIDYATQILDALDAAHRRGITHRDLKPANILVTRQGIKLLDFGLAKQNAAPLKETDMTQALTSQGQIVGTLQYMSPEQLQGKDVDARSDLFSFGCLLYEMLCGKMAFTGESAASVIAAILEREPAPLAATPPVERIIARCLAKDPDQRFQTARDLKIALLWAREQQPIQAPVRRFQWPLIAALIMISLLAGWALSRFRQLPADARVLRLQIDPPAGTRYAFGSTTGTISISPDGKFIAFAATGIGKNGLWVRSLDSTEARLIPGTENAGYPFWSPDSKSLAYFAAGAMKRVDLAGGSPQTVCEAPGGRDGAWWDDGQILFSVGRSGLFRVPATGGSPAPVTTLDASRGESSHGASRWLPGQHFLFRIVADKPENTGIYVGSLAKPSERHRLIESDTNVVYVRVDNKGYVLFKRGQTLLAQELDADSLKLLGEPHTLVDPVGMGLASNYLIAATSATGLLVYSASTGATQPTWFDRSGKFLREVGERAPYWMFRLSPDGRRLAAVRDNALWLLDVERGVSSRFTPDVRPMFPLGPTMAGRLSTMPARWKFSAKMPVESPPRIASSRTRTLR